ncbi:ribosome maturation factor RimM [Dehalobacterium formicoaceticum]|uniref:Ribosome maturation factor RimM n=1 Tax=Dehalobacterium formicoaceticum TaxID=51515 RepID=A0ABT1Y031_9FIRM|nr:ribosome maturation factor RimM [Dehalobacterium formicoaceticum]MCR6544220.1 ribosome maturation factor RimM [Dehalobacterium formicoaceticum]
MEKIIIGKILSPHGVKGELKVMPLTDYPDRFYRTPRVWIDGINHLVEMEEIREQMDKFLIKFHGVDDRDEAAKLSNRHLAIDQEQMIELPPGHFYHFQIIGLQVYEPQGTLLGDLVEIIETGSNDVYVVERAGKKDLLIPALKSIVREIDIHDQKRMVVDLPPGLDD